MAFYMVMAFLAFFFAEKLKTELLHSIHKQTKTNSANKSNFLWILFHENLHQLYESY